MRQEAGEPYYRISVGEAKTILEDGDAVVIDVRTPDEYKDGHIKGALWMPVDDVLSRVDELPKDKKLLFICAVGQRSGLACEMASAMGYDSEMLYNIEDGTPTWLERDYPASYGLDP